MESRENTTVGNWYSNLLMDGMGDNGNKGFLDDRCSINWDSWCKSKRRSSIGRLWHTISLTRWVLSLPVVGDLRYEAVIVVGRVLHVLDPSIGQGNVVGALSHSCAIVGLGHVEVGLGVVVRYGVVERVRRDLREV